MNCLKSVRFIRDFGTVRLAMVSISAVPVFFVLFEAFCLNIHPNIQLSPFKLPIFLAVLLIVYPLHKICHCLPLWACGKMATLSLEVNANKFPIMFCNLKGPVSRNTALACVGFPIAAVSALTIAAAFLLPQWLHYFSIIGSLNFGMSMSDCLYMTYLLKASAKTFVEDDREGFHILVQTYKSH
ncbi:MAG TPA: DUF3267 domain-containing protein [Bacillales bacterium]|nr:DUF3267 domain-containing protein [Bacillales bacterium]